MTAAVKTARTPALGVVLVPTDFSKPSLQAFDYAAALLGTFSGTLHFVHVHEVNYAYAAPALLESPPPLIPTDEIMRAERAELNKLSARYAKAGQKPTTHVKRGRAFDEVCELATALEANLIVIATKGLTGLKHLLLGSTAEQVVRHSPCPVLVVRAAPRPEKKNAQPFARILVPVDFSAGSRAGVAKAIFLARATGAKLIILHAVPVLSFVPSENPSAYHLTPAPGVLERAARTQLRQFVNEIDFKGVPFEAIVRCGRAADEICDFAAEKKIDLIVTSTHGRTGFAHVLIGSVAEHVVRHAPCPVLTVPARRSARR